MEVQEQIKKFGELIEASYKEKLLERIKKDERFLLIDFSELAKFEPELADELLEQPEEVIKAAEIAIEQLDMLGDVKRFRARFFNLPQSQKIMIRNIRSKHINKLLLIEGTVRQKSDVRPQVISAKFECPSCGNIINVLQLESKFREPTRCGCGRKGKFRLLDKEMVDAQGIVLEESSEDLEGGEQPKRMNLLLKNDLVSPITEKRTNPGSKIRIVGILKEIPILAKDGGKSTRFDLMIEANSVDSIEEDFSSIIINEEEKLEIIELSKDPKLLQKLTNSIVPSIYGHERIKEAVLMQMFGGARKVRDDGSITRGDIHILLIGDPGAGKCLHHDTKIMLGTGEIAKIGEFVNQQNIIQENKIIESIFLPSLQFDGKISNGNAIRIWKRKCAEKMIRIKTRTGKEIISTKDHPFFYCYDGYIIAKEAKNFSVGERLATPRKLVIEGNLQTLPKFKPEYANNSKKLKFPEIVNKELSRLLGYLCVDGYLAFSKTSGWVSLTNNDEDVQEDFSNLMKVLFGCDVKSRNNHKGKTAFESYVNSRQLTTYFEKNFNELIGGSSKKNIPAPIIKSGNDVFLEFIKGLFECDSHVNIKKRQIEYSTINKELAENLQYSLLRYGIISILKQKNKYATNTINKRAVKSYELIIGGRFAERYIQEIGFASLRKKKECENLLSNRTYYNTNIDLLPGVNSLLKRIRIEKELFQKDMGILRSSYCHYEQENRLPSVETVKQICAHLKKNEKIGEELQRLDKIAHADIFWDEILEIEEIENIEGFAYDLEVTNTHNYLANGVLAHNSQILKRISKIAPKGRFVSGKGASGAGLTAAVVKDEFMNGWSLEAGALVLGNKGICCIDELDKMSSEDRDAMHEALEGQTVTISKANIQATLRAETTVLAAANPKFGRFDPYEIIPKQIDLPSTLINRFDLIFPVRDLPNQDKDDKLASFVLNLHQSPDMVVPDIDSKMLRKYFAYARQHINPILTDGAIEEIKKYYLKMRGSGGEGEVKSIPISARQLEALIRLSEASAKLTLSDKVTRKDAKRAVELMHYCLVQVGMDPETGTIDIDRISTGIPASERSHISTIKEIINELEKKLGKTIPIDDIVDEAKQKGVEEEAIEEAIQKLKRAGDIFEPRRGFISRI